ncbi:hypothetical protein T265_15029, partial [Opisthorchis viverrini]
MFDVGLARRFSGSQSDTDQFYRQMEAKNPTEIAMQEFGSARQHAGVASRSEATLFEDLRRER